MAVLAASASALSESRQAVASASLAAVASTKRRMSLPVLAFTSAAKALMPSITDCASPRLLLKFSMSKSASAKYWNFGFFSVLLNEPSDFPRPCNASTKFATDFGFASINAAGDIFGVSAAGALLFRPVLGAVLPRSRWRQLRLLAVDLVSRVPSPSSLWWAAGSLPSEVVASSASAEESSSELSDGSDRVLPRLRALFTSSPSRFAKVGGIRGPWPRRPDPTLP